MLTLPTAVQAATLPEHDPLRVVIVSDEVNPHGLPAEQLTQPGEIGVALEAAGSGINLASVSEVGSECIDDAVDALESGSVDVMIYFAHRAASLCGGGDGQTALTAATQTHLRSGGGVVVFHHGIYTAAGKQPILELLGGTAGQIAWDTNAGQDVINVAPDHFVTSNGIEYGSDREFGADELGVPQGAYGVFNNTPDERYPGTQLLTVPDEIRTTLFASDYQGSVVLGYDLRRPDWSGHVVLYQPGEYQPAALDDLDGNNFQVLANAIYYVGTTQDEPTDPTGDATESGGTGDGDETGPDASDSASDTGGQATASASAGGSADTTTPADPSGADTDTDAAAADEGSSSCRVATGSPSGGLWLALGLALGIRRRRRSVVR